MMKQLQKRIKETIRDIPIIHGLRVAVFGSSLHSNTPKDIDILLLYDASELGLEAVSQEKSLIIQQLYVVFSKPVHITTLSIEENKASNFSNTVKAVFVHTMVQFERCR